MSKENIQRAKLKFEKVVLAGQLLQKLIAQNQYEAAATVGETMIEEARQFDLFLDSLIVEEEKKAAESKGKKELAPPTPAADAATKAQVDANAPAPAPAQ